MCANRMFIENMLDVQVGYITEPIRRVFPSFVFSLIINQLKH